ncbi:MAG TPA: hypothetical protein VF432_15555 [Thermoanaerobaculia bacterium]
MIRPALAFLAFLIAHPLAGQESADLAAAVALDATTALTGERVSGTLTVTNQSGIAATEVTARVSLQPVQQELTVTAPAGWTCEQIDARMLVNCRAESFPAHAQAAFRFTIVTRNDMSWPDVQVHGGVVSATPDGEPGDNEQQATISLAPHPATTALSVRLAAQQNPVTPGTPAVVTVDARNDGPATANDLRLRVWAFGLTATSVAAPGWSCSERLVCTRPALGPGDSAPITISFATTVETAYAIDAELGAERSFDPNDADNRASIYLGVGDAARWKRILLPVVMAQAPGANGSLWTTDVFAHIDSDSTITLQPRYCDPLTCRIPQALRRPFRLSTYGVGEPGALPGQFVYTLANQADRLTLNLRVRDLNRTAETWGTEVPAVREEEFRTTPITLMPLPVDPLFRTTLRVYDFDARPGAGVTISIYADGETTPRATLIRTFATRPDFANPVLQPRYPGYLQIDPLGEAGAAMAGATTASVRIEPRSAGLRFWAFASVTNNPTGHVTTVTPR